MGEPIIDSKGRVALCCPKRTRRDPEWRNRDIFNPAFPVVRMLPFVRSRFGTRIHRVRSASIYTDHRGGPGHTAVQCWCGPLVFFSRRHSHIEGRELLRYAPEDEDVCGTCEGRAIGAGQVGSSVIQDGRSLAFTPTKDRLRK